MNYNYKFQGKMLTRSEDESSIIHCNNFDVGIN